MKYFKVKILPIIMVVFLIGACNDESNSEKIISNKSLLLMSSEELNQTYEDLNPKEKEIFRKQHEQEWLIAKKVKSIVASYRLVIDSRVYKKCPLALNTSEKGCSIDWEPSEYLTSASLKNDPSNPDKVLFIVVFGGTSPKALHGAQYILARDKRGAWCDGVRQADEDIKFVEDCQTFFLSKTKKDH